jgi:hypothetical protein
MHVVQRRRNYGGSILGRKCGYRRALVRALVAAQRSGAEKRNGTSAAAPQHGATTTADGSLATTR